MRQEPLVITKGEDLAAPLQHYCRKASPGRLPAPRARRSPSAGAWGYPLWEIKSALDQAYAEGRFVTLDRNRLHDPTPEILRDGRFRPAARFGRPGPVEMQLWVARR
jgi:hypothetical protein